MTQHIGVEFVNCVFFGLYVASKNATRNTVIMKDFIDEFVLFVVLCCADCMHVCV